MIHKERERESEEYDATNGKTMRLLVSQIHNIGNYCRTKEKEGKKRETRRFYIFFQSFLLFHL